MYSKIKISGPALFLFGVRFIQTIIAGFPGWHMVQRHYIEVDPLTPEEIEASIHEREMAIP